MVTKKNRTGARVLQSRAMRSAPDTESERGAIPLISTIPTPFSVLKVVGMRISRKKRRRKPQISEPAYRCNEQIRAPEIRVIDIEGGNLGVMPTEEAIKRAQEKELDLVEVHPKAEPPIAKIMDYGQFKYQKEKEARKLRAKQHKVEVKVLRISVRISDHDMKVRLDQAKKFLESGDKVKIDIVLRGRERRHPEIAKDQIKEFTDKLNQEIEIKIEQPIAKQGSVISALVAKA